MKETGSHGNFGSGEERDGGIERGERNREGEREGQKDRERDVYIYTEKEGRGGQRERGGPRSARAVLLRNISAMK